MLWEVFRNVFRVLGKMVTRGELFKGAAYHGINTTVELCMKMPFFFMLFALEKLTPPMLALYYLS